MSTAAASQNANAVAREYYGTPDQPAWPELSSSQSLIVDAENLLRSAGPVSSGRDGRHQGLFREHCVTCHAVEGSGAGPASVFQNPYPRDFRHGVFKWKSTLRGEKPTRQDIRELLVKGSPGTAMPSFALLDTEDLDALVDYVIYLSTRGEVERRLMAAAVDELDYGSDLGTGGIDPRSDAITHYHFPEPELRLTSDSSTEGGQVVQQVMDRVHAGWAAADENEVPVPAMAALKGVELAESVQRGKNLFHGKIANCAGCHGPGGDGSLQTLDYDDWAKEYSTRIGLTPTDREAMKPFRDAGALYPRLSKPRDLRNGVFHGGGDAASLYQRITQGIAGTPMPALEVVQESNGKGLTVDEIGDLVRYVQQLSTP